MKQYYCFLERFNNYFNRKIIMYDSLLDYENNSKDFFIPEDSNGHMLPFDFNPNDNVMSEVIVNDVPFDADYFLLLDEEQNIVQRWFILEQKRNRQGQWVYTLKRDVIADHIDTLFDAPIFVQKGMLPEDDPFIVNDEGMNLNKIKTSETLLKDKTQSAWVVAYVAKNSDGLDINISVPKQKIDVEYFSMADIADELGVEESVLTDLLNQDGKTETPAYISTEVDVTYGTQCLPAYPISSPRSYKLKIINDIVSYESFGSAPANKKIFECSEAYYEAPLSDIASMMASELQTRISTFKSDFKNMFSRNYFFNNNSLEILKSYNGKVINYLGKFYRFNVAESNVSSETVSDVAYGLYTSLKEIADETVSDFGTLTLASSPQYNRVIDNHKTVYLQIAEISSSDFVSAIKTQISSSRYVTEDQEFDIICFPANDIEFNDNGTTYSYSGENSLRLGSKIALEGDAVVYDVQLLPYCPLPEIVNASGQIDLDKLSGGEHYAFDYIKDSGDSGTGTKKYANTRFGWVFVSESGGVYTYEKVIYLDDVPEGATTTITNETQTGMTTGITFLPSTVSGKEITMQIEITDLHALQQLYINTIEYSWSIPEHNIGAILYVQRASFQTQIELSLELKTSMKVDSNCDLYRLVSGNYQGAFEFNVANNGGKVNYFSVYCTYKPYTPFIKVCPAFNFLYGNDYNDNRGLICGGDYSLPRTSSAWQNYQLNNKNYQNIFNREIQHMDFNYSIESRNAIVSGIAGALSDTAKGAGAGAIIGGGVAGAVAGGVIGGITSAVGAGIDVDTLARRYREEKQLAIDKFNYQLGNIKALPYTLTKIGSFDVSSKIFPFIEYYTCSGQERTAFENKIKYESMTVMRIGTLAEFMNFNGEANYFKGILIRNDTIADDPHTLNAIYEEFLKGVYI